MMNYAIVYSSKTGNTAMLAEQVRACLPQGTPVYTQTPEPDCVTADILFIGFWTDKGSCDESMSAFLSKLRGKKIFLFGTAGFGGSPEYFAQILSRVAMQLDSSNTVVGSYMCQGKMPESVRQRYEAMLPEEPDKAQIMLETYNSALSHPDAHDLKELAELVRRTL